MNLTAFDYDVNPATDGLDHIRVHPAGLTALGRAACNAARSRLIHPEFGQFASLEGYWHWLRSGRRHETLRSVSGHRAVGIGLRYDTVISTDFRERIIEGLRCKFVQNRRLSDLLVLSTIPFLRYTRDPDFDDYQLCHAQDWFFDALSVIRKEMIARSGLINRFEFATTQLLEESILEFQNKQLGYCIVGRVTDEAEPQG
jgi:hypothetical protein